MQIKRRQNISRDSPQVGQAQTQYHRDSPQVSHGDQRLFPSVTIPAK